MKKVLLSTLLAAALSLSAPLAADAGETKFRDVAPRSEHSRHYGTHHRTHRHDRYRPSRHYRSHRSYSRYRYRPHSDYVYRPFPSRYSHYRNYNRYYYDPYYRHYRQRGDGLRITPYGLTIFIDLDD